AELGLRQIAHMAHRRLDDEARVRILLDRLHLRRRLHYDQRSLRHYVLLARAPTETHRCPVSCRAHPPSSSATSVAATREGPNPPRAINCSMCCGSSGVNIASTRPSSLCPSGRGDPCVVGDDDARIMRRHGSGNSDTTSCQQVISLAPSWRSRFVPALIAEVILPGTANTSRPRSPAKPAVIRAPLRSAASTTTTPRLSPASVRLRAGQWLGDFDAVRRGVARADDRERERIVHGDRAAHVERRRRRNRAEQRGIVRVSWIELVHGSARRSGGSVYRTGPPGQRLQADTVARGASAGPRRPCEGVTRPSSPAPSPGSPAPRAATSGAPGSDRAGPGDTGRS